MGNFDCTHPLCVVLCVGLPVLQGKTELEFGVFWCYVKEKEGGIFYVIRNRK